MDSLNIIESMGHLFSEVQVGRNAHFKVPLEMRPTERVVYAKEAYELITESIDAVLRQLFYLLDELYKTDPNWETRLKSFIEEWESSHPEIEKQIFGYLKFRLEARMERLGICGNN